MAYRYISLRLSRPCLPLFASRLKARPFDTSCQYLSNTAQLRVPPYHSRLSTTKSVGSQDCQGNACLQPLWLSFQASRGKS